MDIDTPFVADPARDSEDARAEFLARFRSALGEFEAPFVEISGSWKERKRKAIVAIDAVA